MLLCHRYGVEEPSIVHRTSGNDCSETFGCQEKVQLCDVVKLGIKTAAGTNLVLPFLVVPSICEPITGQPVALAKDTYPD